MNIGIDAIAFDIAKLHLPIRTLAAARDIDPDKLEKGLGLRRMTIPDVHQDTVTFGANAVTKLIEQENLDLNEISRIYVGTESGIDNSKPIGSFIVSLLEQKYGEDTLNHCDTADMTFACIGAVDALQNCIDYIRLNPSKKAIVVATDIARYDLGSTGEYTQGAGALAMLVASSPKIIAISNEWGVSTRGAFDFFKPYRTIAKSEILGHSDNEEWFGNLEAEIRIHKDQPVFDGQYSNQCYMDRTREAYYGLRQQTGAPGSLYNTWKAVVMHLPYAYQGRRMFSEIFALDAGKPLLTGAEEPENYHNSLKEISKSDGYKNYVNNRLRFAETASSLIGNLYTGSIFMGFLSAISEFAREGKDISGTTFGFLAYGSGSKAKAFEGKIQDGWKAAAEKAQLFETLSHSHEIGFDTYLKLHKKEFKSSILQPHNEWALDKIECEVPNLTGARYYKWHD